MEYPQPVELALADFYNQVIHSWVWMLSGAEEPPHLFDGIYVSSDRKRRSRVYFLAADTLVRVFRAEGHDDIVSSEMQRDSNGDMHITKASRELPPDLGTPRGSPPGAVAPPRRQYRVDCSVLTREGLDRQRVGRVVTSSGPALLVKGAILSVLHLILEHLVRGLDGPCLVDHLEDPRNRP